MGEAQIAVLATGCTITRSSWCQVRSAALFPDLPHFSLWCTEVKELRKNGKDFKGLWEYEMLRWSKLWRERKNNGEPFKVSEHMTDTCKSGCPLTTEMGKAYRVSRQENIINVNKRHSLKLYANFIVCILLSVNYTHYIPHCTHHTIFHQIVATRE